MTLFISHTSAYEHWRSSDAATPPRPTRLRPSPGKRAAKQELRNLDLHRLGISGNPLDIMVATPNERSQASCFTCHLWNGSACGPFARIADNTCVCSPETTFVQMGAVLPLVDHVRFGYELCGAYARRDDDPDGFRTRSAPLTTVRALEKRTARMAGMHGVKQAVRALRFVAERSASPMETNLAMSLCLPRMLGGYGLDLPELNYRIEAREAAGLLGRDHFVCDLYWKKHRIAAEYDSKLHHEGAEAETSDSSRRSALALLGITVVSITPDQYFDARRLDETARALAKLTGKRLPPNDASWMMKRYRLRKAMLEDLHGKKRALIG